LARSTIDYPTFLSGAHSTSSNRILHAFYGDHSVKMQEEFEQQKKLKSI